MNRHPPLRARGLPPHPPPGRPPARPRPRWPWLLAALAALLVIALASGWLLYQRSARTPSELIDSLRVELGSRPLVYKLARPFLDQLEAVWVMPGTGTGGRPFVVPPPGPNPALANGIPAPTVTSALTTRGVLRVGPGRAIPSIRMAAKAAQDGDLIEIDPGDYKADVAVWTQKNLTIRGMGPRVRLIAGGAHAEGKGIWVIKGGRVTVENIDFIGARVPDKNGAGIRFERGQLTVRNCLFYDNQNGILTGNDPATTLVVENSEFAYNGRGDGQTHGLYVGRIRALTVTGSHFHHGNVGHLVKSRAAQNRITYNRLVDGLGGRTSYELEFPDGGLAEVVGNLIHQSPQTANSVMLSYGAEGMLWPENRLSVTHNSFVNGQPQGGTYVRVYTGADAVLAQHNLLAGRARLSLGDTGVAEHNPRVELADLADAQRMDFRLHRSVAERSPLPPLTDWPAALVPRFEYRPGGPVPLAGPPTLPGALQSLAP